MKETTSVEKPDRPESKGEYLNKLREITVQGTTSTFTVAIPWKEEDENIYEGEENESAL